MKGYRMKYTGEEVENRLGKVEANEESIAAIDGRVTANEGKVTEIEGSITKINGSIDTLMESVAAVDSKADGNYETIMELGAKFHVAEFTMTDVRMAAAGSGMLETDTRTFYLVITRGKLIYIKDYSSLGKSTGACVPQTYEKDGIATAVIYDTLNSKWYTLTASSSDRYITVTASDTINLMDNEIYTTEFTEDDIIMALGGGYSGTLNASNAGFVSAVSKNKTILIPRGKGGAYLSLSGGNDCTFLLGQQHLMVTIAPVKDFFSVKARYFNAYGYGDREQAYMLPGSDSQAGSATVATMTDWKVCYRSTQCPSFTFDALPQLRVGEVMNLRYIFTKGLGDVRVGNKDWTMCRNIASSTDTSMLPAILDITAINPGESEKIVVFYTITKFA